MTVTQVILLVVLSIVGLVLIGYGIVTLVRTRAQRRASAAAGEAANHEMSIGGVDRTAATHADTKSADTGQAAATGAKGDDPTPAATAGTAQAQTKSRTGLAVAALLFGLAPILFVADVVMVEVTDGRVSLNGWWLAGFFGGALTPATVTFLLGIFVLAWWPLDPRSPRRFAEALKNPRTRGPLIWNISRDAVVLVGVAAGLVGGFWLSVLLARALSEWPSAVLSFISLIVLLASLVLCGMAAKWLFVKLVRRPKLTPPEGDPLG